MKGKIPWIALSLMLIICSGCFQTVFEPGKFKPGSEPDGFRGIKWGTDVATLSGMKCLSPAQLGLKTYVKMPEDLKIEGVNFEEIFYLFQEDKFFGVLAVTSGYINCLKLESALFKKYGWGQKVPGHRGYGWSSENHKTLMSLGYNKNRKNVRLTLKHYE
jgi:hypothetical protein